MSRLLECTELRASRCATGADAVESWVKELDGKLGVEPVEAGP
jgi:hypothetical protein